MTTVEGSAMLELFVNPTYVVEVFLQQFAVLETSMFVVAQITLLSTEQKSLPMRNFVSKNAAKSTAGCKGVSSCLKKMH